MRDRMNSRATGPGRVDGGRAEDGRAGQCRPTKGRDEGAWFAPKLFGFGAGLPIAWQGWALLGGYLAVVIGAATWLQPRSPLGFAAVAVIATAALMAIAAQHTCGGWRWRWGGE